MREPDDSARARRRIAASWDANAAAWARAIEAGTESRRAGTDAAVLGAIRDALRAAGGGRVLDVGCGEGWLLRALRAEGVRADGIDGSAELARTAGARHLTYAEAIVEPARLGGPYAVAVFSFALLDDEPAPLLRAVTSRLSSSGRVVIQTLHPISVGGPYEAGWREESFEGFGDAGFEPMPWFFHTFESWSRALEAAGLTVERTSEPRHPETRAVLSLVLTAAPTRSAEDATDRGARLISE